MPVNMAPILILSHSNINIIENGRVNLYLEWNNKLSLEWKTITTLFTLINTHTCRVRRPNMGHSTITPTYLFHYSSFPLAESRISSQLIFNEFHFNLDPAFRLFSRLWKASMAIVIWVVIFQCWGIHLFICDFISSIRLARKSWLVHSKRAINKIHTIYRRRFGQIYSRILWHRLHRGQISFLAIHLVCVFSINGIHRSTATPPHALTKIIRDSMK